MVRLVRVRRLGEKVWSPATCVDFAGPRSFLVKTGDVVYRRRRNRRDLLSTGKTPVTDQSDLPVTAQSSRSNAELPGAHFPAPDTPKSSACESDTR